MTHVSVRVHNINVACKDKILCLHFLRHQGWGRVGRGLGGNSGKGLDQQWGVEGQLEEVYFVQEGPMKDIE